MPFNPLRDPIDTIDINGARSPGVVEIRGAGSPRQWDERRGFGMSGAISVYRGRKLAKFGLAFTFWTPEQFDEWATFSLPLATPPNRMRPRAIDVYHPILADLGIRAIGVEDLTQPEQVGDGLWCVEVKCVEYRRPRLGLATPDGDGAATPDDPVDREIDDSRAQLERLVNQ